MTRFFVQLPARDTARDTMTLDLDLETTTVAAVKATVDARLESIWRASGVRILRSDLPFCGVRLNYQNSLLAMDRILSSCKVGKNSTLYAQWPQKSEKDGRRKRYGKGWENEPVLERRRGEERELKRAEREEKGVKKKALREAPERTISRVGENISRVGENTTQSASETSGDEQISCACVSDDRSVHETEVEAEEDCADVGREGAQSLSGEVAGEEQHEQQVEGGGQEERQAEEREQDDPFADEDSDKENREPFAPVVENRVDDDPVEEWLVFDESNSGMGMDLLEEVLEF